MNLLITGAAGFIGSHLLEYLLKSDSLQPSKIVVLDALRYSGLKSNIDRARNFGDFEFVLVDLADYSKVKEIFEKYEISDCINVAAESHVDRSIVNAKSFFESNIIGVFNLLESFRIFSSGRFLQVSTDEVYGSIDNGNWSEASPLKPRSPYAASKASADLIISSFVNTYGTDAVITRCSNNYGPRQFPEKFIPLAVTNLLVGKKIPIYGNGKNIRDWIHVSDHCQGILKVFMNGNCGEIYNIGGHHEVSNIDLARQIISIMGLDTSLIQFVEDRKGHDFRYSVDDSKVREGLRFVNLVNFEIGLRDTIDWYSANETWWRDRKSS